DGGRGNREIHQRASECVACAEFEAGLIQGGYVGAEYPPAHEDADLGGQGLNPQPRRLEGRRGRRDAVSGQARGLTPTRVALPGTACGPVGKLTDVARSRSRASVMYAGEGLRAESSLSGELGLLDGSSGVAADGEHVRTWSQVGHVVVH